MKTISSLITVVCLVSIGVLISCRNEDLSSKCFEGFIPRDTIYRAMYSDCYKKSIWVEVLGDRMIGKNVKIYTASPGPNDNPVIEYKNIIEVPLSSITFNTTDIDSLYGTKFYFRYRNATDFEKDFVRDFGCTEVYNTYEIPLLTLTYVSLNECLEVTDK
ncbi:MAG: hypothetical protein HWD62_00905 [Cyclobacteriaceae bacterium]|nr:MAG: hypothetical protein HWD62_00905 [Cyclobacteriaceae bacterium]